jgi:hypothetical protein
MFDWSTCSAVERDPERVSGAWVFCGTRVPVAARVAHGQAQGHPDQVDAERDEGRLLEDQRLIAQLGKIE